MSEARSLLRKTSLLLCPALAVVGALTTLAYPTAVEMITGSPDFVDGWLYFAILMAGVSAAAGYTAFGFILNQWGHPGWFTGYLALTVVTNIALNAWLIPPFGALGAATATALTTVLTIVYLKVLTRRATGVAL